MGGLVGRGGDGKHQIATSVVLKFMEPAPFFNPGLIGNMVAREHR